MREELTVSTGKFRYVLLCRHARHDEGRLVPVKDDNGLWRFPTESVASVLAEELVIGRDQLRLAKVAYAPTPEARRTTTLLLRRLKGKARTADEQPPQQPVLDPENGAVTIAAPTWIRETTRIPRCNFGYDVAYEPWVELMPDQLGQTESGALSRIEKELEQLDVCSNALLVVGHQPQMGWLSKYLSRGHRARQTGKAIPIAASEVACLRLQKMKTGWRGQLCWQLAPDDSKALDAVSDKVKGKMESAKLLSAVITLGLTALLGVLLDTSRWTLLGSPKASIAGLSYSGRAAIQVAFVLLLIALALYLVTMYSYDRLLMPARFWAEGPDRILGVPPGDGERPSVRSRLIERRTSGARIPRRPPSSSAWVVFRNMQRIWYWLFTPANILVALALAILAAALLRLHGWGWALVAVSVLLVGAWAWWFRPILGSED